MHFCCCCRFYSAVRERFSILLGMPDMTMIELVSELDELLQATTPSPVYVVDLLL